MTKVTCKKSIYKSTYRGYAFNKNVEYTVSEETEDRVWVIDNTGQAFSFCKAEKFAEYLYSEHFEVK